MIFKLPSRRKHPTHTLCRVLLRPSLSSPDPLGCPSIKGKEGEEQEEEHPQQGQAGEGAGGGETGS